MTKITLIIVFSLTFFCGLSQNRRDISGIVKDQTTGQTLPGATVIIEGTSKGASTDLEGKFAYTIQANTAIESIVLVVSYLGFETQRILVGNKSFFEILLTEDSEALDEVVITSSYGTKKLKQEVVGSIARVKTKDIVAEQPVITFDELLEGQLAGVYIETNNRLGEETKINIRGQGSLTPLGANVVGTSTQPLIIVDGIILAEEVGIDGSNFFDAGTGNISENILNPLAKIGVQDIESFDVLKDAAAVGLYGADAANGVIIITTKSGRKGKLRFNAQLQSGISSPVNQFKFLSGEQYQTVFNLYNTNSGNLNAVMPWNGIDTDWFSLLNKAGTFNRYTMGASGGTKNWSYRANGTYQKNNEAQVNNSYTKLNTTLALDYKREKISVSLRFSPSITEKNDPNTLYAFAVAPTISVYDADGNYTPFETYGNPVAVANQNKKESQTFGILNSLSLNYQILDNLKFTTLFGLDYSEKEEDNLFSGLNGSGQFNDGTLGRRILRERNTKRWNWSANLFYNTKSKSKHYFDALLGIETRQEMVDLSYARGRGFAILDTPQPISTAESQDYQSDSSENTGRSIFTQLNYDFKKKYFFLVNFRVDQSSAFGSDNNTAINGGLGASWVISNEGFFSKSSKNPIEFLRLRASYGSTGNSRIGSYRALGLYTVDDDLDDFDGYNGNDYANPSSAPNPNLGWERNNKFNLGIDVNAFKMFKLTLEVFRDDIKDLIVSRNAIPESGFNNVQINGAEMYNQGIEFSIQANWLNSGDFKWNTNFNISKIENEVTSLVGLGSNTSAAERARAQRVGFSTSTIWGFDFIGIDPATGRALFNVDGNIYDASYVAANFDSSDWQPIGDSQPDFFGGLRNSFSYKGVNLNVIMAFAYGQDALIDRNLIDNYRILSNRNVSVNVFDDAWQQQGDNASLPLISDNNRIISNSSKYLFDETHINLRSINLSYDIPVNSKKNPFKALSIFVNAANVKLWYKDKSAANKNGIAEYRNVYPQMRTISLGVNASF
ncbi:SusC/RagA family TonB-linked outer membrane protein [Winogradskyella schleiferi]|uniref:SusC/RagA family TonB-linked outer membrane protein n=1 Tax=Winogradskyella schleiferi TaxID=2686078 RepID=UPI0015C10B4D|nr:SusC/RagA family TonB-linked outer membrane protein [Winogradskyella schleiferi]